MGMGIDAESMNEPSSTPHGPSGMRKCCVRLLIFAKRDFRLVQPFRRPFRSTFPFVAVALFRWSRSSMALVARCGMFGFAIQQIERMGQHRQCRAQGTDRARRASGHIQDHRVAQRSAEGPAQRCHRCLAATLRAHHLSHALEQPIADRSCGFGSHIALPNAGSAGGYHQPCCPGCAAQCVFDGLSLVWDRKAVYRLKVTCVQCTGYRRTRKVLPQALGAGIADGDDGCGSAPRWMMLVSHVFDCTNRGKSLDLMRK